MKTLRIVLAAALAACVALPAAAAETQLGQYRNASGQRQPIAGVAVLNADGSAATGAGDASAANQTAVQAAPGSDSTNAVGVQGVTGGKPVFVDLTRVGGASVTTGHGVASGALRVELPTDGTGVVNPGNTPNTVPWLVAQPQARSATYGVDVIGYAGYATPTDLVCLVGSATKTVVVYTMSIRVHTTAAALQTFYFIKRSAANTGGTATAKTPTPFDSANAAATAVLNEYSVIPAGLGASAGTLRIVETASSVPTAAAGNSNLYSQNGNLPNTAGTVSLVQPVVLRGTAQSLCINFNGAALGAGWTSAYTAEWSEY